MRQRHVRHVALIAMGFLVASSGVAWAYFSATGSGTYALATAGHLNPPTSFSATATSSSQVTLTWAAPSAPRPGTYTYVLTGALGTGGTCTASMSTGTTSCSVEGLTGGTSYSWTLRVKLHTWLSATTQASATTASSATPIVFVGAGAATSGVGLATPATVAYPSHLKSTDLLLLLIARSHNNTVTCPTGWTKKSTVIASSGSTHGFEAVCDTKWTGSGSSVAVAITGTNIRSWSAEVIAFRHVTPANPFDTAASATAVSGTNLATFTSPGVTTAYAGDMALSVVMENATTSTTPVLSLHTARTFTAGTSAGIATGTSEALDFAYKTVATKTTAVSYPTWNTTQTASGSKWLGISLALRDDPPPPTGTSTPSLTPALSIGMPTVSAVSPTIGGSGGGTSVTISGTNFTKTSTVSFGATPAASVTVNGPTSITATSPPHTAGPVSVTVTTTTGTSATSSADVFTYTTPTPPAPPPAPAPTVTGVTPATGSTAGGTTVTISGTNFTATATVSFGGKSATSVTVNGSTSITATSPAAQTAGPVDVTVTEGSGTSATTPADQFTYTSSGTTP